MLERHTLPIGTTTQVAAINGGAGDTQSSAVHVADKTEYDAIQHLAAAEPANFWALLAPELLHWLHPQRRAWLARTGDKWTGWTMPSAAEMQPIGGDEWTPWHTAMDSAHAPIVRWFLGGVTSAAFNELDRQVLRGYGDAVAFISDSADGADKLSVRELFIETSLAASVLDMECASADGARMALYLPNDMRSVVWISAAKRVAIPYVAIASGTASSSLANRLADTGAALLLTSEALVPMVEGAFELMETPPKGLLVGSRLTSHISSPAPPTPVDGFSHASSSHRARSVWASLVALGGGRVEEKANGMGGATLVAALWQLREPSPVDANFPLFILYTSGSTGKPKGIVHTHGGYQLGLCATSNTVFDLQADLDVFFVIATPGWITGQSYMIAASLLCRVPSVRAPDRSKPGTQSLTTSPELPSCRRFMQYLSPHL